MSAQTKRALAKQALAKQARRGRINAALDRIAAAVENGELMLATDQAAFFEAVAEHMETGAGR